MSRKEGLPFISYRGAATSSNFAVTTIHLHSVASLSWIEKKQPIRNNQGKMKMPPLFATFVTNANRVQVSNLQSARHVPTLGSNCMVWAQQSSNPRIQRLEPTVQLETKPVQGSPLLPNCGVLLPYVPLPTFSFGATRDAWSDSGGFTTTNSPVPDDRHLPDD